MRGINDITNREEVVDILKEGKFELLALTETKERCMETYREQKRKVKRCIIQSKKEVNEQFGRKMKDVNGKRKLV